MKIKVLQSEVHTDQAKLLNVAALATGEIPNDFRRCNAIPSGNRTILILTLLDTKTMLPFSLTASYGSKRKVRLQEAIGHIIELEAAGDTGNGTEAKASSIAGGPTLFDQSGDYGAVRSAGVPVQQPKMDNDVDAAFGHRDSQGDAEVSPEAAEQAGVVAGSGDGEDRVGGEE